MENEGHYLFSTISLYSEHVNRTLFACIAFFTFLACICLYFLFSAIYDTKKWDLNDTRNTANVNNDFLIFWAQYRN